MALSEISAVVNLCPMVCSLAIVVRWRALNAFNQQLISALNNAVILQFFEQGFHSSLYYHDRWNSK